MTPSWPHPMRGAGVALLTALLGPPIGNAALWVSLFLPSALADGISASTGETLSAFAAFLVYTSVFAFVFAGIAAIIAGLALGLHTARHGTFSYARALATGALAMCASIVIIELSIATQADGQSALPVLLFLVPIAAVSAAICRLLFGLTGLISTR